MPHSCNSDRKKAPISVVIPCFRAKEVIVRALDSVRKQTLQPLEVIVIDDCSEDGTIEILESLREEYGKNWLKVLQLSQNSGPGTARNAGWNIAQGNFIAFLDADDSWHPQKLELQYTWMVKNPEIALTGHAFRTTRTNTLHVDSELSIGGNDQFTPITPAQLLLSNRFATRSVMLKRTLPHRFENGKRHCEDYQLWLEICLTKNTCAYSPLPLATEYKASYGESGLSGDLLAMERGELAAYQSLHKSGLIKAHTKVALYAWSIAKYLNRIFVVQIRKALR